jgi:Domain of unknown function (DUF4440)
MDFAALERRRLAAIIEAEAGALDALHHEEFVLCTPSGDVWDREFYLSGLISGGISYATFEPVSDIEVMASADLAVLRYRSIIDIAIEGGGGGHLECWHLDVYVRDGNNWVCKWSQATDTIGA